MCLNHSFPLYDVTTDAIYQVACQHKEERIVVASLGGLKTTRSYYNQAFRPLSRPPHGTWNFQELHILKHTTEKKIEYLGVNVQKMSRCLFGNSHQQIFCHLEMHLKLKNVFFIQLSKSQRNPTILKCILYSILICSFIKKSEKSCYLEMHLKPKFQK